MPGEQVVDLRRAGPVACEDAQPPGRGGDLHGRRELAERERLIAQLPEVPDGFVEAAADRVELRLGAQVVPEARVPPDARGERVRVVVPARVGEQADAQLHDARMLRVLPREFVEVSARVRRRLPRCEAPVDPERLEQDRCREEEARLRRDVVGRGPLAVQPERGDEERDPAAFAARLLHRIVVLPERAGRPRDVTGDVQVVAALDHVALAVGESIPQPVRAHEAGDGVPDREARVFQVACQGDVGVREAGIERDGLPQQFGGPEEVPAPARAYARHLLPQRGQ